ncbi:MAG: hypothetical protein H6558_04475 [Lewinellaceae bacterium]|nr:hypothetical protein [Lewinellaceae bacterium]
MKQDERSSHIPIILLTAKATSDKVEDLKYRADAYLTKPFDKEELLIRLEKLVEYAGCNATMPVALMLFSTCGAFYDDIFLQSFGATSSTT